MLIESLPSVAIFPATPEPVVATYSPPISPLTISFGLEIAVPTFASARPRTTFPLRSGFLKLTFVRVMSFICIAVVG